MYETNYDDTLGFDFRFLFAYATIMYLIEFVTTVPVMLVSIFIPGDQFTREGGYSATYTQFFPLVLLTEIILVTIIFGVIYYKIDYRRSYMFKAKVHQKTIILEQLIATLLVFILWMPPFINRGSINYIPTLIGSIFAYLFGLIDKMVAPVEIFVTETAGVYSVKLDTIWLALISMLITLIFYNVVIYFARKKGSIDGVAKRKAETEALYKEYENKLKNNNQLK